LGEIIYKTIIRSGLTLIVLWFLKNQVDERYFFFIVSALALFFFVINPAYMSYKHFLEKNQNIESGILCSSCKHFDKSAMLCIKYDKHPTENFIPCEGRDWEPK